MAVPAPLADRPYRGGSADPGDVVLGDPRLPEPTALDREAVEAKRFDQVLSGQHIRPRSSARDLAARGAGLQPCHDAWRASERPYW